MTELNLIKAFLEQAVAEGSKSTVLKPIGWMMLICVSSTLSSSYLYAPQWLIIMFAVFSGLTMLLYLVSYCFCLFTDKDSLRTEKYSIQKLAIEKGFIGDDITGIIKIKSKREEKLMEAESSIESEEEEK